MNPIDQYTPGDIIKMQKDAVKRVQSMRNRERETVKSFNREFNCNFPDYTEKVEDKEKNSDVINDVRQQAIGERKEFRNTGSEFNGFLNLLLRDQEKTLLTVLILLLLKENENPLIILALIYILV